MDQIILTEDGYMAVEFDDQDDVQFYLTKQMEEEYRMEAVDKVVTHNPHEYCFKDILRSSMA